MTARTQVSIGLNLLSILLAGLAGCARPSTPPAAAATPTLPSGWETYSNQGQCSYAISHPSNMDGVSQGTYSWSLSVSATEPSGPGAIDEELFDQFIATFRLTR